MPNFCFRNVCLKFFGTLCYWGMFSFLKSGKHSISRTNIFRFRIQKSICWGTGDSCKKILFPEYSWNIVVFPKLFETLQSKDLLVPTIQIHVNYWCRWLMQKIKILIRKHQLQQYMDSFVCYFDGWISWDYPMKVYAAF